MTTLSPLCNSNSVLPMALLIALCVAGCNSVGRNPTPPPSTPHPNNAPSGTIAWPSWAEDNPRPGVGHAAAYACWDDHVVFVIWADFDTSSGGTSGPTMDGIYRASLTAESGTQVDCECKTTDGISGTLDIRVGTELISDDSYDLEKGNVFLISTHGAVPTVTQLRRGVFDKGIEDAKEDVKSSLRELSAADAEVKAFLTMGCSETRTPTRP